MGWLGKLFGGKAGAKEEEPPKRIPERLAARKPAPAAGERNSSRKGMMSPGAREFIAALYAGGGVADLQEFPPGDRMFLSTVMRKSNDGEIAIPVLPEAALRIQGLLTHPNVEVGQFVEVFRTDPAMSAELLKVANSAYYGFASPTHDLSQAILRVGFNQIRAIVVMAALRSKVLQGRHFHAEMEWVTDLSIAGARACQSLSGELRVEPGEAFTRGLLCHVERFVILGMAADFTARQPGTAVSRRALAEAFHRIGPQVVQLIARKWGLPMLSGVEKEPANLHRQVEEVAKVLALFWAGLDTEFAAGGISPEAVRRAVEGAIEAGA